MHYYRKAAAVFILIFTLILPLFLEVDNGVAVVDLNLLTAESEYLSAKAAENKSSEAAAAEILSVIKVSAAEFAAENNYSSVVTKHLVYSGGQDISRELAKKIDAEN